MLYSYLILKKVEVVSYLRSKKVEVVSYMTLKKVEVVSWPQDFVVIYCCNSCCILLLDPIIISLGFEFFELPNLISMYLGI